jgi:hypothetical protein
MIKDYYNLKKHCLTPYSISNKKYNIGNLTDKQLEISEKILDRKEVLTIEEKRQLESIRYVVNYRNNKASERIQVEASDRFNARLQQKANNKADLLIPLIEKLIENNK